VALPEAKLVAVGPLIIELIDQPVFADVLSFDY
jgi:hypothetical protein